MTIATSPRRSSAVLVAFAILVRAPTAFCWIPRLLVCCRGIRVVAERERQSLLQSSAGSNNDDGVSGIDGNDTDPPGELDPLILSQGGDGEQLRAYVSRHEAIIDVDFFTDDGSMGEDPKRPLEDKERVVIDDWMEMEWDERVCHGEDCGTDDFDVSLSHHRACTVPDVIFSDVLTFVLAPPPLFV